MLDTIDRPATVTPNRHAAPRQAEPTNPPPLGAAARPGVPVIPLEAAAHALGTYGAAFRYRWTRKGGVAIVAGGKGRPVVVTRGELRRLFLADMLESMRIFDRLDRAYREAARLLGALETPTVGRAAGTRPPALEASYPIMRAGGAAGALSLDLVALATIADRAFSAAAPAPCPPTHTAPASAYPKR